PYRVFIEKMQEGALALAADATILYCNGGFSQMVKKPIENIIGSGISQFVSTGSKKRFEKIIGRGKTSSSKGVVKLLAGDGTIVPAHLSINPMQAVNEWAMYMVVTDLTRIKKKEDALRRSRDELDYRVHERTAELSISNEALQTEITEREKAKEKLNTAHQQILDIIEFLPDATLVIDAEKKVIAWNRAIEEMTGVPKEEILGKSDYAYALPFYKKQRPILIDHLFFNDSEIEDEYGFVTRMGDTLCTERFIPYVYEGKGAYLWARSSPLFDASGKMIGAIETIRDVTERKKIEDELELRNIILSTQQETSLDGIIVVGEEGKIISFNRRFVEMWNTPPKVIESRFVKHVFQSIRSKLADPIGFFERVEYLNAHRGEKSRYEIVLKDGRTIDRYSAPMIGLDEKYYGRVWYFRDITKQKKAEKALQNSEEKYRNIVETAQEGIWVLDKDGKTTYVNKHMADMLGYSVQDMLGRHLFCFMDDEARLHAEKKLERRKKGISDIHEFRFRRSDGSDLFTVISTNPIMDPSGQYNGSLGMLTDISSIKKMEEIRLENETLIYANTVKSEFMSVMSHELRTPLSSIIGYSQLLKENRQGILNVKQEYYVNNILKGSKHLLALINSILDMTKIEAGKMLLVIEEVSVPDAIGETVQFIEELAKEHNVVLKKEIDPELDIIDADKQKFEQMMLNLLSNAIKFSKEEGGTVTIRTKKDGEMARISVSDTGIGIKKKDLKRVFLKFEQLDSGAARKYEGTGLGLSITKQLVEMHGGTIMAESTFNEGSTFTFTLPIKAEK
ncbi:MAG: PAS domain S-box protein, partial [Methanosarcinaceae archaeon]|nr:PAS domain S-box protein [Methanosarcinaceae archaeon]